MKRLMTFLALQMRMISGQLIMRILKKLKKIMGVWKPAVTGSAIIWNHCPMLKNGRV
jgi:hypothetical protein